VSLLIDSITGGLMQKWNDENPDKAVRPGDRIVEVNGILGGRDLVMIVEECKKNQMLSITLSGMQSGRKHSCMLDAHAAKCGFEAPQ